ncbi:PhoH family protein [Hyphobacterium sp.]|uniref:PhoH family protein n=1 Tax=Hyphobacterium sp. TaxID=2004662 RepID=UPI003BAAD0DB
MPDSAQSAIKRDTAHARCVKVDAPETLASQLRQSRDVVHAAHAALSPYQLSLKAVSQGVEIHGDAPAVLVMQRWLEQIVDHWRASGTHEGLDASSLKAVINDALKRDLVLRLPGLPKPVRPLSVLQHAYIEALLEGTEPIIIASGPTGTGKTHLALAAGLSLLDTGKIRHMIVARPNVIEEGQTMTPELRLDRVYDEGFAGIEDELNDLIGPEEVRRLQQRRRLEVTPVGRLQGRNFADAFLIIDEAQNMNVRRTRMAVSRLGENSRMVLIGDPNHCELRNDGQSGFEHLLKMVEREDFARIIHFTVPDIIRNPVVAKLEALYVQDASSS